MLVGSTYVNDETTLYNTNVKKPRERLPESIKDIRAMRRPVGHIETTLVDNSSKTGFNNINSSNSAAFGKEAWVSNGIVSVSDSRGNINSTASTWRPQTIDQYKHVIGDTSGNDIEIYGDWVRIEYDQSYNFTGLTFRGYGMNHSWTFIRKFRVFAHRSSDIPPYYHGRTYDVESNSYLSQISNTYKKYYSGKSTKSTGWTELTSGDTTTQLAGGYQDGTYSYSTHTWNSKGNFKTILIFVTECADRNTTKVPVI